MNYAVEARIFGSGRIVAKLRPAREDEEDSRTDTGTCDIWVDIFDDEREARRFLNDYRKM